MTRGRRDDAIALDLPSDARALCVVHGALRALAQDARCVRLAPREVDEVLVAVHEACTNSIRHANAGDTGRRFRVEIVTGERALEIRVRDSGAPFDVEGREAPPPEALAESGYGIRIMRSWMDEVVVAREGGGNVLRMIRRYRTPVGGAREPRR